MQTDDQAPTPPDDPLNERLVHCWAGYRDCVDEGSVPFDPALYATNGTCFLLFGHTGPHEFTRDDEILVTFSPRKEP
jgi:hypothetical protein